jgi:hypothetical protein
MLRVCLVILTVCSCHAQSNRRDDDPRGEGTGVPGVAGSSLDGDAGAGRTANGGSGGVGGQPAEAGASQDPCSLPRERRGWQLVSCCAGAFCNGQCVDGECVCAPTSTHHGCDADAVCCAIGGCRILAVGEECPGGPP